jgi:hypothetical protein
MARTDVRGYRLGGAREPDWVHGRPVVPIGGSYGPKRVFFGKKQGFSRPNASRHLPAGFPRELAGIILKVAGDFRELAGARRVSGGIILTLAGNIQMVGGMIRDPAGIILKAAGNILDPAGMSGNLEIVRRSPSGGVHCGLNCACASGSHCSNCRMRVSSVGCVRKKTGVPLPPCCWL